MSKTTETILQGWKKSYKILICKINVNFDTEEIKIYKINQPIEEMRANSDKRIKGGDESCNLKPPPSLHLRERRGGEQVLRHDLTFTQNTGRKTKCQEGECKSTWFPFKSDVQLATFYFPGSKYSQFKIDRLIRKLKHLSTGNIV